MDFGWEVHATGRDIAEGTKGRNVEVTGGGGGGM